MRALYTITTTEGQVRYAGNGVTTSFATPFQFFENTTISVQIVVGTVIFSKVLNVDYTVTGGDGGTGAVVFTTAPTVGQTVVISLDVPFLQETVSLSPNGPLPARDVEQGFDRIVTMVKQLNSELASVPRLDAAFDPADGPILIPSPVPSKLIGWDSDGTELTLYDQSDFVTQMVAGGFRSLTTNGDGTTTDFTLVSQPANLVSVEVFVDGVRQRPTTDYTLSGSIVTFTTAPPAGTNNVFIRWGSVVETGGGGSSAPATASAVTSLAALRALPTPADGVPIIVATQYRTTIGDGGDGSWEWVMGDRSADVAVDTAGGVWVAPTEAASGASGAWRRLHKGVANARWFGATGDAVRNPSTGVWTGTDDTAALQVWEAVADRHDLKRYLPAGAYIASNTITRNDLSTFQNSSDVEVYGDGRSSIIVNKVTDAAERGVMRYGGTADSSTAATAYLAVVASAGDDSITVNDGTLFTVGMYFYLIDRTTLITDYKTGTTICRQGEVALVRGISGNVVTLAGQLEFSYPADTGAPLTSGTILKRFTAPVRNIVFRDFQMAWDEGVTYVGTYQALAVRRGVDVAFRRLHFQEPRTGSIRVTDVIGFTHEDVSVECYEPVGATESTPYPLNIVTSHFGVVSRPYMRGGRHATDGGVDEVGTIESSHVLIVDGRAYNTFNAPWGSHAGCRQFHWQGCHAANGLFLTGTTQPAFLVRGRFCTVSDFKVSGYDTGVFASFCDGNTVVRNGEVQNCGRAVRVNTVRGITVDGVRVDGARDAVVQIDDVGAIASPDYIFRNFDVRGNPTTVLDISGPIRASWRIENFKTPDATTEFTGANTTGLSLNEKACVLSLSITANQDNYAPSGFYLCDTLELDGGAASRDITGLVPGGGYKNRRLVIRNSGATNNIVLKHDVTSTAANRFSLPGGTDITLAPGESATVVYRASLSRWIKE